MHNKVITSHDVYNDIIGCKTNRTKSFNTLGATLLFALLIISCVGAAGVLPGFTLGWTSIGIGGGYLLCKLAGGKLKKRKIDLIPATLLTAMIVVFGALGGAGILTGPQLSYALIGAIGLNAIGALGLQVYAGIKLTRKRLSID